MDSMPSILEYFYKNSFESHPNITFFLLGGGIVFLGVLLYNYLFEPRKEIYSPIPFTLKKGAKYPPLPNFEKLKEQCIHVQHSNKRSKFKATSKEIKTQAQRLLGILSYYIDHEISFTAYKNFLNTIDNGTIYLKNSDKIKYLIKYRKEQEDHLAIFQECIPKITSLIEAYDKTAKELSQGFSLDFWNCFNTKAISNTLKKLISEINRAQIILRSSYLKSIQIVDNQFHLTNIPHVKYLLERNNQAAQNNLRNEKEKHSRNFWSLFPSEEPSRETFSHNGICSVTNLAKTQTNEDRAIKESFFTEINGKIQEIQFFGVFDGHGQYGSMGNEGFAISEFLKKEFCKNFQKALEEMKINPLLKNDITSVYYNALRFTFIHLNIQIRMKFKNHYERNLLLGSTCTVVFKTSKEELFIGNAGDTRAAILMDKNVYYLTCDQNFHEKKHIDNIKRRGGSVKTGLNGVTRAVGGSQRTALSAGFGNGCVEGFSAHPTITTFFIPPNKEVNLIIGTDGFWNTVTASELERDSYLFSLKTEQEKANYLAFKAANVNIFTNKNRKDDVTVLVADISH